MRPDQHADGRRVGRPVMVTAVTGTVFIAAAAFWLSFTALADLAIRSGIDAGQAWAWPLIVDGIIVVATVSVVALSRYGERAAWYPWALLIAGAVVSVAANAMHAVLSADIDVPGLLAAAVAAVPPLVLLAITHLTVVLARTTTPLPVSTPVENAAVGVLDTVLPPLPPGQAPPAAADSGRTAALAEASRLRAEGMSNRAIARLLAVHPSTVGRWFATADTTTEKSNSAASTNATRENAEITR